MADFLPAFERMIVAEGGYQLTDIPGDRGGQTFAGISRKAHPDWDGWEMVDKQKTPSAEMVRDFYRAQFWERMKGDELSSQAVAGSIFSAYVNMGASALSMAQLVVGTTPDGVIGPKTIAAINGMDERLFASLYALAKVARYAAIVNRDRSQSKFLLGWINRTLKDA